MLTYELLQTPDEVLQLSLGGNIQALSPGKSDIPLAKSPWMCQDYLASFIPQCIIETKSHLEFSRGPSELALCKVSAWRYVLAGLFPPLNQFEMKHALW